MTQLMVAFDFPERDTLFEKLELLKGLNVIAKIGMRSFPNLNVSDYAKIKELGFKLFVDAKLHDIPSQVADAVSTWQSIGADFLTVHISGGKTMLKSSVDQSKNCQICGVSVLTSLGDEDLSELEWKDSSQELVIVLSSLAHRSGVPVIVCSAAESRTVKEKSPGIKTLCPGVYWKSTGNAPDQKRRVSLDQALEWNVDWIVMGREIWSQDNPRAHTIALLEKLANYE